MIALAQGLVKHWLLSSTPRISDSVAEGWGVSFSWGDADGSRTMLWESLIWASHDGSTLPMMDLVTLFFRLLCFVMRTIYHTWKVTQNNFLGELSVCTMYNVVSILYSSCFCFWCAHNTEPSIYFYFILFIYLYVLAVLVTIVAGSGGSSLVVLLGPLITVASLVGSAGSRAYRLQ